MAVLQMQRISICGLKKDRKAILEKMQSLGVMEISQATEETEGFEKMDTVNARSGSGGLRHLCSTEEIAAVRPGGEGSC